MSDLHNVTAEEVNALYERLLRDGTRSGYRLNLDADFARELLRGLIQNQKRYGYPACPCRLASGDKQEDLDIICPCDYRDPDLSEHGACYCALYVSQAVLSGEKSFAQVPERRLPPEERSAARAGDTSGSIGNLPYPVWRCRVCGYLCAREEPPETCPVCMAKKERFERFL